MKAQFKSVVVVTKGEGTRTINLRVSNKTNTIGSRKRLDMLKLMTIAEAIKFTNDRLTK